MFSTALVQLCSAMFLNGIICSRCGTACKGAPIGGGGRGALFIWMSPSESSLRVLFRSEVVPVDHLVRQAGGGLPDSPLRQTRIATEKASLDPSGHLAPVQLGALQLAGDDWRTAAAANQAFAECGLAVDVMPGGRSADGTSPLLNLNRADAGSGVFAAAAPVAAVAVGAL